MMNTRLLILCLYLAGIVVAHENGTAADGKPQSRATASSNVVAKPGIVVPRATTSRAAIPKRVYEGTWITTNRPLDGRMTCELQPAGKEKWRAHFEGIWQGVAFDYTVHFTGVDNALRCDTKVDGAAYTARGVLTAEHFKARFGGDRYEGSLTMKRVKGDIKPTPRPETSAGRPAARPSVRTSRPPANVAR